MDKNNTHIIRTISHVISIVSLRQRVFEWCNDHDVGDNSKVKTAFHEYNWNSVRTYMNEHRNQKYKNISFQEQNKNDISPVNKKKSRTKKRSNKPNNKITNQGHDFNPPS